MGFLDRFSTKKPQPIPVSPAASESTPPPAPAVPAGGVKPRLLAARENLEAKDLPAALAVYEELLVTAGDRADVLVAISGDLGSHGHVAEIIELIAPRYDAERHGAATGLNLLQAYLAARNADAAQHVLDILFALNRPELEDRLHGFSNAIAELIQERHAPLDPGAVGAIAETPKVGLITISKPVWFYGLESMAERLLPQKPERLRRIAFAQLALPGAYADPGEAMQRPEDELGRLSRALPLWFAETFYFSTVYSPVAAVALLSKPGAPSLPVLFGSDWTTDNLRQIVDTTEGGLDYVFTGSLRHQAGDYELVLRVWEVKKFRERKTFLARWNPSSADAELARLHEQVRAFMEWAPAVAELTYIPPAQPQAWLDTLGASLGLFLVEKNLLKLEQLPSVENDLKSTAQRAAGSDTAALAFLTLRARAAKAGIASPAEIALPDSTLVAEAQRILA